MLIEMNKSEVAYIAGLFDGEGSICIVMSKPSAKRQTSSPSHSLQVGITNTNRDLIDWLHNNLGGYISDNSHSPSRKRESHCWAWRVMSNQSKDFLKLIYPFLKVKRRQAELAIQFQETKGVFTRYLRPTTEEITKRQWYKEEITKLNSRHKSRKDAGREFIAVNPKDTSQLCSRCHSIVSKDLSVRIHSCPVCGLVLDRDLNASFNILSLGLQAVGKIPRSPAL